MCYNLPQFYEPLKRKDCDEEESKNTHQYCWKKASWFSCPHEDQGWASAHFSSTKQGEKDAFTLMMRHVVLAILGWYQKYFRWIFPASCRFSPSCSEYARQAIQKYGLIKGFAKALKRLLRCHPFSGHSGYDPVM